jgi:delta 1-pyrroline-5-carboxylate dehydrogenase
MPDGAGIPVENPATGETIATVPELGPEEVRGLVVAARGAQPAWAETGFEARATVLHDAPGVWIGDARAFPSASGTNPYGDDHGAGARRTVHAIAAA